MAGVEKANRDFNVGGTRYGAFDSNRILWMGGARITSGGGLLRRRGVQVRPKTVLGEKESQEMSCVKLPVKQCR